MNVLDRILDANFNRAREALRVLEDLVRFGRDDRTAQRDLKGLRHRLSSLEWPRSARLLVSRDSRRDVGRESDISRGAGIGTIAAANFKRLEEALRSIEEAARGRDPALRRGASKLRFDAYVAEKDHLPPLRRRGRLEDVRLYVLLDPDVTSRPLDRVARLAIRGGAGMVQVRMKHRPPAEVRRVTARVARVAREEGALMIANDRPDPAADGVHLGLADGSIRSFRRKLGPEALIGATTHSMAEALGVVGADYLSCGPMFPTALKPGLPARGKSYWDGVSALGRPVFAIGGITPKNLPGLVGRGIDRIAVCSAVIGADDVTGAARRLCRLLHQV